jgi:hypothetical protein
MKKKFGVCLLMSMLATAIQADIKPGTIDYIVRPLYGYRADGTPGRIVTVRLQGEELKGDLSVEVIAGKEKEKSYFTLDTKNLAEVDVLLPSMVPAGKQSDVTIIIHGADKTYKKKISVTPMRHWNIYLYNHAHVDIGYTNTH